MTPMTYTMVIQACQLNTSLALHHFSPFSIKNHKLGTFILSILPETFKEEETTILFYFEEP